MSARHVLDDLSAYIDGECQDPHGIARHLQSCPECARRHMELLKLSNHVRASRGPDVDPAFTRRVLERLDGAAPPGNRLVRFLARPSIALAVAASIALVTASTVFLTNRTSPGLPARATVTSNAAWLDDEAVVLAFAELLDAGASAEADLLDDAEEDSEPAPSLAEFLDALAAWSLEEAEPAWYEQDDLLDVMEALASEDATLLNELASNHWDEV